MQTLPNSNNELTRLINKNDLIKTCGLEHTEDKDQEQTRISYYFALIGVFLKELGNT